MRQNRLIYCIPHKRVCRILIVQQLSRLEVQVGSTVKHWSLWEETSLFAAIW